LSECKIPIRCPVCGRIFLVDRDQFAKEEGVQCPFCGAVLVLMPKDPNLLWQSLLYKEMQMILRKIEKEYLGGDRW